jgi:hypothetical protein
MKKHRNAKSKNASGDIKKAHLQPAPAPVSLKKSEQTGQGYRQNAGNNTQASEMSQDGRGDYR